MRYSILVFTLVFLSILAAACDSGQVSLTTEEGPKAALEQSVPQSPEESASVDVAAPTPTPEPPPATPEPPTPSPEPPAPTLEIPTSTPVSASVSDSIATDTPTPVSVPATPTQTSTPVPALPTPTPEPVDVPAPHLVDYDGLAFFWEWDGLDMMAGGGWYFDIKIFSDAFAEHPYDVLVAEPGSTGFQDGVWNYAGTSNFQCGSHWAVQIAALDQDGSYAGPLSPESNRLPVKFGCAGGDDGDGGGGTGGDTGGGGSDDEDPCPECGGG
jgi:hypothetical protein